MPGFPEYENYDGLGLAELVRKKEVSAGELVEACIDRIERANPRLNAVVHAMYEQARAAAGGRYADGPFAGVPFLAKDLDADFAGEPMSKGSRLYAGWRPSEDSELARRWKRAGVIVVAKTNTPEFGLTPVTEPELWGPTRNPWDTARTSGGSSGGSAAAVAARFAPIASAGDGGGSIRIPASCCGLFGLKPTRGRNPTGPTNVELWLGCTSVHVVTRSVRDSAAMLDATQGPDAGAPYFTPPPERPFLAETTREPGRLRIAFSTKPVMDVPVHGDCVQAVQETARLLEGLGHEVVEASPRIDGAALARNFIVMLLGETAADVREAEAAVGRKARPGDVEPGTWILKMLAEHYTSEEFAVAVRELKRVSRPVGRFFEDYDVLLTPTLAKPPIPVGSLQPAGLERAALVALGRLPVGAALKRIGAIDRTVERAWSFTPFTTLFNVTGQPAMSVPLHWNAAGLPIGVQFVGRMAEEATLFRLAGQLEQARPWADRRPGI